MFLLIRIRWMRLVAAALLISVLTLSLPVNGGATRVQAHNSAHVRHPLITRTEVVLDVGHGGIDAGTSFGQTLEKDINLAVALQVYRQLQNRNIVVAVNRTEDYALSEDNKWMRSTRHRRDLAQRCEIANRLKPKMLISLHVNWSPSSTRRGPILLYQKNKPESKRIANALQAKLNLLYRKEANLRRPEEAVMGRSYYLLKHCRVPAVIVEMGFLSNDQDRTLLTSSAFQQKLASSLADGIRELLSEGESQPADDR